MLVLRELKFWYNDAVNLAGYLHSEELVPWCCLICKCGYHAKFVQCKNLKFVEIILAHRNTGSSFVK
jgi:hypothetical protein